MRVPVMFNTSPCVKIRADGVYWTVSCILYRGGLRPGVWSRFSPGAVECVVTREPVSTYWIRNRTVTLTKEQRHDR